MDFVLGYLLGSNMSWVEICVIGGGLFLLSCLFTQLLERTYRESD